MGDRKGGDQRKCHYKTIKNLHRYPPYEKTNVLAESISNQIKAVDMKVIYETCKKSSCAPIAKPRKRLLGRS